MIYSYDIFDTVLYRSVPKSIDIFKIMEQSPQIRNLWDNCAGKFSKCRQKAEFWLRRTVKNEITIDDIYYSIAKKGYISIDKIELLKQLEISIEKEFSFLNIPILQKIKNHLDNGEKVVLISDMYWSEGVIRDWLSEKDPVFKEIPIYISCDCNASKSKGTLFHFVKQQEGCTFSEWMHIGDNERADYKIPASLGINAKKISNSTRYDFEKKFTKYNLDFAEVYGIVSKARRFSDSCEYDLGASLAGPMVYQYVEWVLNQALQKEIKILFFVLRDGYIPKIVADEIIKERKLNIKTEFLFGSRVAWRRPQLTIQKLKDLSLWEKSNWIFRDPAYCYVPFGRLGFTKKQLTELFGVEFCNTALYSFADFKKMLNVALENQIFCNQLMETIETSGDNLDLYFSQVLDNTVSYAFVDTNSTGKTQKDLNDLLRKKQESYEPLKFFYHTFLSDSCPEAQTQFVFLNAQNDDQRFPEALFRAPYNPCYGYKQKEGWIVPEFFESDYIAWDGSFNYNSYLKGIVQFTKEYEKHNKIYNIQIETYVNMLMKVVNFDIHSEDVLKQIAHIPFNPDMTGNETLDFYPQLNKRSLLHPFKELIYFPKGSYYLAGGVWIFIYKILFSLVKLKRKIKR